MSFKLDPTHLTRTLYNSTSISMGNAQLVGTHLGSKRVTNGSLYPVWGSSSVMETITGLYTDPIWDIGQSPQSVSQTAPAESRP